MYTKKKKLKLTPRFVCCSVGQLAVLVPIENIYWKGLGMDNPDYKCYKNIIFISVDISSRFFFFSSLREYAIF